MAGVLHDLVIIHAGKNCFRDESRAKRMAAVQFCIQPDAGNGFFHDDRDAAAEDWLARWFTATDALEQGSVALAAPVKPAFEGANRAGFDFPCERNAYGSAFTCNILFLVADECNYSVT